MRGAHTGARSLTPNPSLERRPREAGRPWAAQGSRKLHCPARPKGAPPRGSPQLERYAAAHSRMQSRLVRASRSSGARARGCIGDFAPEQTRAVAALLSLSASNGCAFE
jgi:hypothetical protein